MPNKEYFISKLTFREDQKLIQDVFVYDYDGNSLSDGETRTRQWMVNRVLEGSQISIMKPNNSECNKWIRGDPFTYDGNYFKWEYKLPLNMVKRKTFVSYYHHDDQDYRNTFENIFGDLVISKSVEENDIDSDNSDEYIKQLIQNDYLKDTTVLAVLVGPNTKYRKHVDWEISGALSSRVGGNSGLLGIKLPNHPDYGTGKYHYENLPKRLAKNAESGYATIIDWTDDRHELQKWINYTFNKKNETDKIVNKVIPQMQKNLNE